MSAKVAVLVDVPFYVSSIQDLAKQWSVDVVVSQSADNIPNNAEVFVDLSATSFDPVAVIAAVRAQGSAPIVAFASTVQIDVRERALAAGATEVLQRAVFMERVEQALVRGER